MRLFIQIVHVDVENRRDICIGETSISAEILLRPPAEEWEGHLMPPDRCGICKPCVSIYYHRLINVILKRAPPKKYKYILDGSVRVSVTMNTDETTSSSIPWASKLIAPYYAYDVKDVCKYDYASVPRETKSRGKLFTSDKFLNHSEAPAPPPSSAQHDRLTEPELRWLGSSSNYSVPQVRII